MTHSLKGDHHESFSTPLGGNFILDICYFSLPVKKPLRCQPGIIDRQSESEDFEGVKSDI